MMERIKNVFNFKKPSRVILFAAIVLVIVLSIGFALNQKTSGPDDGGGINAALMLNTKAKVIEVFSPQSVLVEVIPDEPPKQMTLDDVRAFASKGDALHYTDFPFLRPSALSSTMGGYNPTLYGVEGGYRLLIHFNDTLNPGNGIESAMLQSIWESGGSGVDIRYNDIDEFLRTHPSHPAIIGEEALAIAERYAGKKLVLIDVDWWEREDEFPHNSKDPFKRTLDETVQNLDEICELFTDTSGGFFAVGRESGAVYVYRNEIWVVATDADTDADADTNTDIDIDIDTDTDADADTDTDTFTLNGIPQEVLDKIYLGMTNDEVSELFGEPDYHASGLMWFGYDDVGTFNPGINGRIDQINIADKNWSIDELIITAVKQQSDGPYYVHDGAYPTEAHTILSLDANKDGFTVYIMSLWTTFLPDGDYNVREVGGTHSPLALTFTKNQDGDYELTEYWQPNDGTYYMPSIRSKFPEDTWDKVDTQLYIQSHNERCYDQAMYFFVGAVPHDGRYSIGTGTAVVTNYAESEVENESFIIKYFPGATLQIEEYDGEHTAEKPGNLLVEYADSGKNISIDRNGTAEIQITDDLIGIYDTGIGDYVMKFVKYMRSECCFC